MSDEEPDDRWSSYVETDSNFYMASKAAREPEPDLAEYLSKVLLAKSPREEQERKYKVCATLVKLVTGVAYAMSTEWKTFFNADSKNGVKTTPVRTLSEVQFECMVPLIRPMRLDAFKVVQRGIDEMPLHRCLIQVNPALCREEAQLVRNEWDPYIDQKGFLRPKAILRWFNLGLDKACKEVLARNHNVDMLVCKVGADGTATLHVTMTEYDDGQLDMDTFSVNIYPVFTVDTLPSSLKLNAPIPCFGNYIHGQKTFRELVLRDVQEGKQIVFLDPKTELDTSPIKSLPADGPTWKLNLSFTEYHVYSLIDEYCHGLNFRHVLILMIILREENIDTLSPLNNEILVNNLFLVSQKHIHKLRTKAEWIFQFLQTLIDGLKHGFIPCFYLPRQNLLRSYGILKAEQKALIRALQLILDSIKAKPKTLYDFCGYQDENKKERGEDETDNTEEDGETSVDIKPEDLPEHVEETHEVNIVHEEKDEENAACDNVQDETSEKSSNQPKQGRVGERSDIY